MKCSRCQIALPNEIRTCPKCGTRQWRWLKAPALWIGTGALVAILLGPGSFGFGLIAWLLLALVAVLAPWREWLDFPVKRRDTETKDGVSRPSTNEPRHLSGFGLSALQAAGEGSRSWFDNRRSRFEERFGAPVQRYPQPTAGPKGLLYVISQNEMRAYDAKSGDQRWKWQGSLIPGAPAVSGELVVVRTADALVALDASSGEQRWTQPLAPAPKPAPLPSGKSAPTLPTHAASVSGITPAIEAPARAHTIRRSAVRASPAPNAPVGVVLDKDVQVDLAGEPKIVDSAVWYPVAGDSFTGWIVARNLELPSR